jgi:hypothetical protein
MMKDFTKTAEQLKELAKVLNEFKSEAVQVKLVELLFTEGFETAPAAKPAAVRRAEETPVKKQTKRPGRPPKQKAEVAEAPKTTRKRSTSRPGPSVILKKLIESNFFTDSRTIGDVVDYCMKVYNYEYKSTDLSGTLAKLAKDNVLSRVKNPQTNQFEYSKA